MKHDNSKGNDDGNIREGGADGTDKAAEARCPALCRGVTFQTTIRTRARTGRGACCIGV
jgi:hypothetical protein